ncbi:hypothetical protein C8J56DRAFT_973146 [Mycena floridula]|nr:hypothetical protein C8J56DRAFT_973146 [Mycena floridula]
MTSKIKGAFEVIHGVGDNIRGTALGAVDTVTKSGETKNDRVAEKGRLETQDGLQKLKGKSATASVNPAQGSANPTQTAASPVNPDMHPATDTTAGHGYATNTAAPNSTAGYPRSTPSYNASQPSGYPSGTDYAGNDHASQFPPQHWQQNETPNQQQHNEFSAHQDTEFPQHHRDDAISNDPEAIAVGQQYATDPNAGGQQSATNPSGGIWLEDNRSAVPGRTSLGTSPEDVEFGEPNVAPLPGHGTVPPDYRGLDPETKPPANVGYGGGQGV